MNKRSLPVLFFILLPLTTLAEDCMVTTTPPAFIENFPGISEQNYDREKGSYAAKIANGDSALINFATCDLALRGHYLVARELTDQELKANLISFITYLLPSQEVADQVLPKLRELAVEDLKKGAVLKGRNDEHKITLSPASSPLYQWEIHYEWLPPLY